MAGAKLSIRSLGHTEPTARIIFSMASISVLGSALCMLTVPGQAFVAPPSLGVWAMMIGAGVCACGVQVGSHSAQHAVLCLQRCARDALGTWEALLPTLR